MINPTKTLEQIKSELVDLTDSINKTIETNRKIEVDHNIVSPIDRIETQGWINEFNRIIQILDKTVERLEKYMNS